MPMGFEPISSRDDREALQTRARAARERSRELLASSIAARDRTALRLADAEARIELSRQTLAAVHASVSEYAFVRRHQEVPPEEVIIEVKDLVRDTVGLRGPSAESVMSKVVSWAVEGYYAV